MNDFVVKTEEVVGFYASPQYRCMDASCILQAHVVPCLPQTGAIESCNNMVLWLHLQFDHQVAMELDWYVVFQWFDWKIKVIKIGVMLSSSISYFLRHKESWVMVVNEYVTS